jgi:hypothetical protein
MITVGVFLVAYKGYDKGDKITCTLAGISGVLLALFPCKVSAAKTWNLLMLPMEVTTVIHYLSAGLFFLLLIYMIGWRFTKIGIPEMDSTSLSDKFQREISRPFRQLKFLLGKKKTRNFIYIVCAIVMALCLLFFAIAPHIDFFPITSVYYAEALLLFAFGFAWIVKGETLKFLNG